MLIFCREICFSNWRRSLTSAPYFPVVPLSARMKCEWRLFKTVNLLKGLDIVWYGRTTWPREGTMKRKERHLIRSCQIRMYKLIVMHKPTVPVCTCFFASKNIKHWNNSEMEQQVLDSCDTRYGALDWHSRSLKPEWINTKSLLSNFISATSISSPRCLVGHREAHFDEFFNQI